MPSSPFNTIGSIIVTFIVTLVLNTLLNYYTSDKGAIGVSRPLQINGARIIVVTIENQTSDFLNGLFVEVPDGLSKTSINADPTMVIEEIGSLQGKSKFLKLSQISPRVVTRLFLPVPAGDVRVVNPEASGLALRQDDRLESPLRNAIIAALFVATLYAIVEGISTYIARKERKILEEKIESLKSSGLATSEELKAAKADLEREVGRIRNLVSKQRLLLQARIFDYSRELSFWRNLVKSLLLNAGRDSRFAHELFENITSTLETHGTKASAISHEATRVAANWLLEAERDGRRAESSRDESRS